LYLSILNDIEGLFATNFTRTDVVVAWRDNDVEPRPDPLTVPHYLRNLLNFGRERVIAFGAGPGSNERLQFGSVSFIGYASRSVGNENTLLSILSDAMKAVRGVVVPGTYGVSTLSFIGDGSGFDVEAEENGNWYVRGARYAFEYRFRG
jgi:hypothetical protein